MTKPINTADPAAAVRAVLDESRNGMNQPYRHALCRRFYYSDGAVELAEAAGAYWLLDIIGTEAAPVLERLRRQRDDIGTSYVEMTVHQSRAELRLTLHDNAPPAWTKTITYTDFPEGEWVLFEVGPFDDLGIIAILPSEH